MTAPDTSAEVRRALAEATPGPWEARKGWNLMPPMRYEIAAPNSEEWCVAEAGDNDWGPAGGINKRADAHLIANAPTWLAQLCDEIDRLRTLADEVGDAEVWLRSEDHGAPIIEAWDRLRTALEEE